MLIAFLFLSAANPGERRFTLCAAILSAWAAGYALTWASKWGLAAALSADPIATLRDIADVMRYRIDGSYEQVVDHRLLAPSANMLRTAVSQIWAMPSSAMLLMLLPSLCAGRCQFRPRLFVALTLPALIPFLWFEILSNHTQIHATVVYRPIASSIGILVAAWLLSTTEKAKSADVVGLPFR
ncbi:hypothetical protein [Bradyrhizobium arachidis]|uniref:hypothetical protein n=1 Tax=Bradyrhizobium arachidis TaxID=858423 RepID=UPI0021614BF5|nr:hypothetical protein [Bradyrhizobium arachidis]UVO30207.1 hypothetical protein KUF59_05440 [Bradyrhizobium arachidis]